MIFMATALHWWKSASSNFDNPPHEANAIRRCEIAFSKMKKNVFIIIPYLSVKLTCMYVRTYLKVISSYTLQFVDNELF